MSFIKRLGNVSRGWVSHNLKRAPGRADALTEAELREAEARLHAERGAADARAADLADRARAAAAHLKGAASAPAAPEELPKDDLGLPRAPKPRSL